MTEQERGRTYRLELGRDNYESIEEDEFGNLAIELNPHGQERLESIVDSEEFGHE